MAEPIFHFGDTPSSVNDLVNLQRTPQANTVDLGIDELFPRTVLQANEQIWRQNEAERQRQQKRMDDAVKMMDFDTAGMLNEDRDVIMGEADKWIKKWTLPQNFKAFIPTPENMQKHAEMMMEYNKIKAQIDAAKVDKKYYDLMTDEGYKNPDKYKDWKLDVETFKGSGLPGHRTMNGLTPADMYNPLIDIVALQTATPKDKKEFSTGKGNQTYSVLFTNPEAFKSNLISTFNGVQGIKAIKHYDIIRDNIATGKMDDYDIPVYDMDNLVDKNTMTLNNPIGYVKASEATNQQMFNAERISPAYYRQQGLSGTQSLGGGGGGSKPPKTQTVLPYFASSKVSSGMPSNTSKYGNIVMYNGNMLYTPDDKSNNKPITVAMDIPEAYNLDTGELQKSLGVKDITLFKVGDVYRQQRKDGKYNWLGEGYNIGYDKNKQKVVVSGGGKVYDDYTKQRMVLVSEDKKDITGKVTGTKTYLVPYEGDIKKYIEELNLQQIDLNDPSTWTEGATILTQQGEAIFDGNSWILIKQ